MRYLLYVSICLGMISTCAAAQTKVHMCWKGRYMPVVRKSPFLLEVPLEQLPLYQKPLIPRHGIDFTHLVLPPELSATHDPIADGELGPHLPSHLEFRICQVADIGSDGSIQIH